ncbi:MAG: pyridoxal 5'-phosphate synthase glutaminase subunit PdxT [Actinobacteria bacterium]|nr:pyridoxal 5'-phosphate synthase glutaminase subunit PdxT [Actinomycetota bacterium]
MAGSTPRVGVLALQGAFREHINALQRLGADAIEVRTPADLAGVDGIMLPGGESTTMDLLLGSSGLREPLAAAVAGGTPVFGTCAGLILLARDIEDGVEGQRTLQALDVTALRNGYGRQVKSFEGPVALAAGGTDMVGIFIRAPRITRVGEGVEILARLGDEPVAVRSGSIMAATFHPELTDDDRLHEVFLAGITNSSGE